MNTTKAKYRNSYLLFIAILMLSWLSAGSAATAGQTGRRIITDRHIRHDRMLAKQRLVHHRTYGHGKKHILHRGSFYKRPRSSLIISASIGSIFRSPPVPYRTVVVSHKPYFVSRGIYYRKVPAGFVVVEPPTQVVVASKPSVEIKSSSAIPEQVVITAAGLNVRTGPGLNYSVINQVQRGDTLPVKDKAPGWLYVELPSGQYGWVMDSFAEPFAPPASG